MKSLATILILLFSFSSTGFAETSQSLEALAGQYFAQKYIKNIKSKNVDYRDLVQKISYRHRDRNCDDDYSGTECMDFVCEKLGTFGCDTQDELARVGRACRGVRGSSCMESFCGKLGTFGCDSIDEIEEVGASCRGVRDTSCVDYVCQKFGTFGCDEPSELARVGESCRHVETDCIKAICSRLGTFGCDEINEIEDVARSCRGE